MFTSLGMDEYCKAYRHDLSGGRTIERHAVGRNLIGKEIGVEKLIFGSDCAADEVHEHVERFEAIFE